MHIHDGRQFVCCKSCAIIVEFKHRLSHANAAHKLVVQTKLQQGANKVQQGHKNQLRNLLCVS